ncbi:MAG: flagellar filament capping protein FliD [Erythrobacter sp.]|jgi:flagellar hook-associated protein 2|nr:flagellar filament capping protein FliD [Erythrobacter sp.]
MDSPGSSIIAAFGAGSGINFVQLAGDLSEASFSVRRENLATRNESLKARISAAGQLRANLTGLASAFGDRIRGGDLAPRARIGNASVANIGTTPGITPRGNYALEVTQLAQGQTLVSRSYGAADALVGEGNLRVRFGMVSGADFTQDTARTPLDIVVDASDTLETLAGKIASASGGALEAYVATGPGGAQLVVKGEDGSANGFVLEGVGANPATGTPGDLSYLSWQPAGDAGELRQSAQDALFSLDTVERTSGSNQVSGLPEGITLTLTGTNAGTPTSIAFDNDTSAITAVMGDLVAALNGIAQQVNADGAALGGTLGNDAGTRELKRDLARLSSEIVMPTAADGEPATLADLGLSVNRDGTFRLDSQRLQDTLANEPQAAAAMFTTGPFGVFATIDGLARDNTRRSDPGSLGGSLARYEGQIARNDERLARIADQQDSLRERLTRDLLAAERRVTASQSTLSFLEQQIDIWNQQGRG